MFRCKSLTFVGALILISMSIGCKEEPQSNLPTIKLAIGSRTFTLEVAADDRSREKGLMRRDSMPDDHGMIFVFDNAQPLSFWMHNTRIPLDIIYADANGRIVSIKQMEAYDEHTTPSDKPAKYAIELNKDAARDAGAKVGNVLYIPKELRRPQPAPDAPSTSSATPSTNPATTR